MTQRSLSMCGPYGCGFSVVLALLVTTGCATVSNPTKVASLKPAELSVPPDWEYKIQAGDQIDIKFYFNPDLSESLVVRPDGKISLQLVPEMQAAGLTPRELTEALKREYSRELAKPELSVIMRTFSAQRIFVGGEVGRPGERSLVGSLTVLQAVAMAEGFKNTARMTEVILIRRRPDGRPLVMPLNIKAAISGADLSQDLALMPYDVVHVPRSTLASANLIVDQVITKMIPVNFGFRVDRIFFDDNSGTGGGSNTNNPAGVAP
jgi:protein involved in polysaccharide export with SLBB domain